ncbi:unnamed protein product [Calypogeia fissa]
MKHKRFSSRVEIRNGIPWWTQVKTNIDNHVFEIEFTPEQKEDKNCVFNYSTDVVLHKPFDESRSLWDVHLVDAKLGSAEVVFWYSVIEIGHAGATLIWMKDRRTVISGYAGMTDLPLKYRFISLRVDEMKSLSKATGVTINDVFMAIATQSYVRREGGFLSPIASERRFNSGEIGDGNQQANDGKLAADEIQKHDVSRGVEPDHGLLKKLDSLRIRAVALMNMRAGPGLLELSETMNGRASQARWGG